MKQQSQNCMYVANEKRNRDNHYIACNCCIFFDFIICVKQQRLQKWTFETK